MWSLKSLFFNLCSVSALTEFLRCEEQKQINRTKQKIKFSPSFFRLSLCQGIQRLARPALNLRVCSRWKLRIFSWFFFLFVFCFFFFFFEYAFYPGHAHGFLNLYIHSFLNVLIFQRNSPQPFITGIRWSVTCFNHNLLPEEPAVVSSPCSTFYWCLPHFSSLSFRLGETERNIMSQSFFHLPNRLEEAYITICK